MPTKRKQYKKHITKTQKKGRNGRKITKRNKHSRKFMKMRNKKYSGGGTWIDADNDNTFNAGDVCPICLQHFSATQDLAIYKTHCSHIFHNNCLNDACARVKTCPICRSELEKAAIGNEPARADCTEVRAFATKKLDNNILDKKNRDIYDAQPEHAAVPDEEQNYSDIGQIVRIYYVDDIPHINLNYTGPFRRIHDGIRRIYDEEEYEEEEQVFRVNPVVGTCYDHVEATRREGIYPDIRYFAPSLNRVYLGRFVKEQRRGVGDGQQIIFAIFVDNNDVYIVPYRRDTCFIEVPCPPLL